MSNHDRPAGSRRYSGGRSPAPKIAKASGKAGARRGRQVQGPPEPAEVFEELQRILVEHRSPEALKRGLILLERSFRARSVFASIHDSAFDRLNVALVRGRADPRVKAVAAGEGPIGKAWADQLPVVERKGAWVSVPMIARGEAIGVFSLTNGSFGGSEGEPSQADLALIGAVANACAAAVDMSRSRATLEQRAREIQVASERLKEGDRTRDALLSHLSHELRTPLTTIKGYLSMARKGRLGTLNEKQERVAAILDRNADRLLRLINDLLLTARLEAGQMTLDPKPLGMRSVLEEAVQFLQGDAETADVTLGVEAPEGEVFVRGNRDRLVEGVMHLLERGLRGKRSGERIEISVAPQGRLCTTTVTMTGLDVPEAELPWIFEAFRSDGGPANVGLSIARQIVELHGGHLRVERSPEGLRFRIGLPLFAGAVTAPSDAPARERGEILVVEDDDDCREGIVAYLSAEGFRVRAYADGQEALERIQEVPPALVLLDLRMPGVDGMALIHAVREGRRRARRTPIYVISGAIDAQSGAQEAWGEKVDGVFEKPINFPFLLERVRELVQEEES